MQKAICYRELEVWKKSKNLVIDIYKMTSYLPNEDKYSLADQIRRAAISIPSNIAEGQQRYSIKEFIRFTSISKGSVAELITQLEIVSELYPELVNIPVRRSRQSGMMRATVPDLWSHF